MHDWSEEDFDWAGLNDAGDYIGLWLRKWARMNIRDIKEKFGTLRIYCSFGWQGVYYIYRPGYVWYPSWWPIRFDNWLAYHTPVFEWINRIVVPLQQKAYVWRYKNAVKKWPHLKDEIICCADYPELLLDAMPEWRRNKEKSI